MASMLVSKSYSLQQGQTLRRETADQEVCLVLLSGKADVQTKEESGKIGQRMSVFEQIPPYSVYVANNDRYEVTALTPWSSLFVRLLAPGIIVHV